MDLKNKNVLIVGAGISGIAAAGLLQGQECRLTIYDGNEALDVDKLKTKLPEDFDGDILAGKIKNEQLDKFDMAVLSPGVPTDLEFVQYLNERKVPVIGEIELAYLFARGIILGITGTNGKTTTTTLVGEILKTYFDEVFVAGNIGVPYTKLVKDMTDNSVTVIELSSFQLETTRTFKPHVSAVLNITPDHLDRHHTMDRYAEAKFNIALRQDESDFCVLNYEDELIQRYAKKLRANIVWFSSKRELEEGLYLDDELIMYAHKGEKQILININDLNILGRHNYENVMAGAAMGICMNIPLECIQKALKAFVAVEHRIEYVAEKYGVKYYNDSKGTNPDASIQAIKAMKGKTLLIGGGYDKGSEYDEWIKAFDGKVKWLVLMGQTRDKIAETARKYGVNDIVMVESMAEAVEFCRNHAEKGESVLLSPCCASWGMFKNYEERGKIFKELVHGIK